MARSRSDPQGARASRRSAGRPRPCARHADLPGDLCDDAGRLLGVDVLELASAPRPAGRSARAKGTSGVTVGDGARVRSPAAPGWLQSSLQRLEVGPAAGGEPGSVERRQGRLPVEVEAPESRDAASSDIEAARCCRRRRRHVRRHARPSRSSRSACCGPPLYRSVTSRISLCRGASSGRRSFGAVCSCAAGGFGAVAGACPQTGITDTVASASESNVQADEHVLHDLASSRAATIAGAAAAGAWCPTCSLGGVSIHTGHSVFKSGACRARGALGAGARDGPDGGGPDAVSGRPAPQAWPGLRLGVD